MDRAVKRSWIALGLVAALAVPACAFASDAQDLGSSQPFGPDVSSNPQFHVYTWQRNGVTFIQVNDAVGNIDFAAATGGGQALILPIGHPDAVIVAPAGAAGAGDVVYAGATATVRVNAGTFVVTPTKSSAATAVPQAAAACQNPADCSQAVASPVN